MSVINTTTNTVVGLPIMVGNNPQGIAITPDGTRVYVTNNTSNNVSVIDTATNTIIDPPIMVGDGPAGIAITPPPPQRNIPTLSEWGLIATAGILGIIGLFALQRRKATA